MNLLLECQCLPPVSTFQLLNESNSVTWDVDSYYEKKSFRNRFIIATDKGAHRISVPLQKGKNQKQLLRDVQVYYQDNWQTKAWESIQSAYGRSPFFEYYEMDFRSLFFKKPKFLIDFNSELCTWLLDEFQIPIHEENSTSFIPKGTEDYMDFRDKIQPNTRVEHLKPYPQVFSDRQDFIPNCSAIDLLFNEGPNSKEYL